MVHYSEYASRDMDCEQTKADNNNNNKNDVIFLSTNGPITSGRHLLPPYRN